MKRTSLVIIAALAVGSLAQRATAQESRAFGDGVFVNYDFVPGDRVIFSEDFSRDHVGDFPKRLLLRKGNFEVAEWEGQRYLRTNSGGVVVIPLPEALPKRFTFEADYNGGGGWSMSIHFVDPDTASDPSIVKFSPADGSIEGGGVTAGSAIPETAVHPIAHIAVMSDGSYVKAYVNGVRIANVPTANLGRSKAIFITTTADESTPAYLGNIRVAAGGRPLYDELSAKGRVSTHGILFDVGSDRIRAESKPTLDEIGAMLRENPDLKLTIEGHTDDVGAAAANQALSDKRAAAVKNALVSQYQIGAARLSTKGLGASKPAASNATAEGRQQNRRVELVKM